MIGTQLFSNGEDMYLILRVILERNLSKKDGSINADLFNAWKEHLNADKVLKKDGSFLFCKTVEDVEWEMIAEEALPVETLENTSI